MFFTLLTEKSSQKNFLRLEGIENKKFFIQVNTGKEKTKSGIYLEELNQFINYCKIDLSLNIIGLMCIPPINDDPKKHFSLLAEEAKKNNLPHLSMGMSADYMDAIELTLVIFALEHPYLEKEKNENQNRYFFFSKI